MHQRAQHHSSSWLDHSRTHRRGSPGCMQCRPRSGGQGRGRLRSGPLRPQRSCTARLSPHLRAQAAQGCIVRSDARIGRGPACSAHASPHDTLGSHAGRGVCLLTTSPAHDTATHTAGSPEAPPQGCQHQPRYHLRRPGGDALHHLDGRLTRGRGRGVLEAQQERAGELNGASGGARCAAAKQLADGVHPSPEAVAGAASCRAGVLARPRPPPPTHRSPLMW